MRVVAPSRNVPTDTDTTLVRLLTPTMGLVLGNHYDFVGGSWNARVESINSLVSAPNAASICTTWNPHRNGNSRLAS